MKNIAKEFEEANPINVKDIGLRKRTFGKNARITSQGRMYGVTDKFDQLLLIKGAIMEDGEKMIAVSETTKEDLAAIKSSAVSTRIPFVNVKKLCEKWFGPDCKNWKRDLRFVESDGVTKYYEVVEKTNKVKIENDTWNNNILECIRRIGKIEFTMKDICRLEKDLQEKHLDSNSIRASISHTLQELRDAGLIAFIDRGKYRITAKFMAEQY